jgi:hypothetical protein
MYLIHVKDILKNEEFIYNIKPNETFYFENCIKFLKSQLPNENQNKIKYNIFNEYCEIYYDSEFKNKGWVWSSIEIRKDIIYILTKIKILDNIKVLSTSTSTQTDIIQTGNIKTNTTQSNIDNIYNQCNNLNFINEYSSNTPYYNDNYFNCLNNRITKTQLSSGYAKNPIIPMWPDNLITELEQKFSELNFGLNHTNPNYF